EEAARSPNRRVSQASRARSRAKPPVSESAENHPEDTRAAGADVVPAVRSGTIYEGAVAFAHSVQLVRMAERHVSLQHVKELHLAGLDANLVCGNAPRFPLERRHHRANLPLEQPRTEHHPALGAVLERDQRAFLF